jgi:hypothetical protein
VTQFVPWGASKRAETGPDVLSAIGEPAVGDQRFKRLLALGQSALVWRAHTSGAANAADLPQQCDYAHTSFHRRHVTIFRHEETRTTLALFCRRGSMAGEDRQLAFRQKTDKGYGDRQVTISL